MNFAGLEKLRIPKTIATPPRKLKMLANLGNPEQLDVSENVEQTRTTRKRRTQKGNVGNIEDATKLKNQRTLKKAKKSTIRKTTLPPAAGRDVLQNPLHHGVLHP